MSGKMRYKVGDEFSNHKRLTKYVGSHPKFRTSLWMWECTECGRESGPSLTNSITRLDRKPSCCFRAKRGVDNPNWKGYKELTGSWLHQYQYDCRKKGRVWDLTPEYLWSEWEKQNGKCIYTGMQLTHGVDASLDRIDSSIGYVEGNVQWVHRDINRMKSDFDEAYFVKLCKAVGDRFA
ncbi:hypothetical protein SEA_LIMPID_101 [Streptomyces phage Limpid]|uniref:Uncharacterized protein n=1 Tax=Streptomyces phage Limpid TaxID=2653770 RepID=A0A5Q2WNK3_9CAUD|nr:hypothetical protein SEA_LIMPID_101 [Streptomyces phage Limpid]